MCTASWSSSRHKLWTYCLVCHWLGCWLCSGGLKGCIFPLLVELNTLVYLVMLYREAISFEQGSWMGIWTGFLNGAIRGLNGGCTGCSHMGLILVPLNSSHHADHFDTWLAFLWLTGSLLNGAPVWGCKRPLNGAIQGLNGGHTGQSYGVDLGTIELSSSCWSFWYLAHFSMTNSSLLNRDPEQGFWTWVLNGAVWGLNGGHTGWSYGVDFGTIGFSSSCWSFWYLAHFSMTDSSLLNRAPVWGLWEASEQGCKRLDWQFLHSTLHLIKHNLALGDPFGCRWGLISLAGNDLCPWRWYT